MSDQSGRPRYADPSIRNPEHVVDPTSAQVANLIEAQQRADVRIRQLQGRSGGGGGGGDEVWVGAATPPGPEELWVDTDDEGSGGGGMLPPGGLMGETLRKASDADDDATWVRPIIIAEGAMPEPLIPGQVLFHRPGSYATWTFYVSQPYGDGTNTWEMMGALPDKSGDPGDVLEMDAYHCPEWVTPAAAALTAVRAYQSPGDFQPSKNVPGTATFTILPLTSVDAEGHISKSDGTTPDFVLESNGTLRIVRAGFYTVSANIAMATPPTTAQVMTTRVSLADLNPTTGLWGILDARSAQTVASPTNFSNSNVHAVGYPFTAGQRLGLSASLNAVAANLIVNSFSISRVGA